MGFKKLLWKIFVKLLEYISRTVMNVLHIHFALTLFETTFQNTIAICT